MRWRELSAVTRAAQTSQRNAVWSLVHGYANLILSKQIDPPADLTKALGAMLHPWSR